MNTGHPGKEALHFAKEFLSNQVARFAPKIYADHTRKTGRGDAGTDPLKTAYYFLQCFNDYQEQLDLPRDAVGDFLRGKDILEYGPGDTLCMALLFYAHGARQVSCVDRFPLSRLSVNNIAVYHQLLGALPAEQRDRAQSAFNMKGLVTSGFDPAAISYKVTRDGLAGANGGYDLILSRAVLEHVNNLAETMRDIKRNLRPRGLSIHKVDLKSHGLDRHTDFDFLTRRPLVY
ncbi:MAG TPA: methyltransferase domain-containing protein, partial [Azonexus sp.]